MFLFLSHLATIVFQISCLVQQTAIDTYYATVQSWICRRVCLARVTWENSRSQLCRILFTRIILVGSLSRSSEELWSRLEPLFSTSSQRVENWSLKLKIQYNNTAVQNTVLIHSIPCIQTTIIWLWRHTTLEGEESIESCPSKTSELQSSTNSTTSQSRKTCSRLNNLIDVWHDGYWVRLSPTGGERRQIQKCKNIPRKDLLYLDLGWIGDLYYYNKGKAFIK